MRSPVLFLFAFLELLGSPRAQQWSNDFTRAGLLGRCFGLGTFDGDLIAGGQAFQPDGRRIDGIVSFDGNAWRPIGTVCSTGTGGLVRAVVEWNGELYAGGFFSHAGGQPIAGLARWTGSGWQQVGGAHAGELSRSPCDVAVRRE